jgi:hypothetical protein
MTRKYFFSILLILVSCKQETINNDFLYKDSLLSKDLIIEKLTDKELSDGKVINLSLLKKNVIISKLFLVLDSISINNGNIPKSLLVAKKKCNYFKIDSLYLREFLVYSEIIDGTTWDFDFEHYPCWYETNVILRNNKICFLKLNAGGWGYLRFSDTTYILGYYKDNVPFLSKGVRLGNN